MPIIREGQLDIISHSPEQTTRLGVRLGALLRPGDVICLSGDMGAGKTVFARGLGKGWGAQQPLTSPTFNLVHEHHRDRDRERLFHLDCYRLQGPQDVDTIGFDDILDGNGAVVIEWPERIAEALPAERLWIELRVIETTRRNLVLEGTGKRHQQIIADLRSQIFGA